MSLSSPSRHETSLHCSSTEASERSFKAQWGKNRKRQKEEDSSTGRRQKFNFHMTRLPSKVGRKRIKAADRMSYTVCVAVEFFNRKFPSRESFASVHGWGRRGGSSPKIEHENSSKTFPLSLLLPFSSSLLCLSSDSWLSYILCVIQLKTRQHQQTLLCWLLLTVWVHEPKLKMV